MVRGAMMKCIWSIYVILLAGCYYDKEENLYPASFQCTPAVDPAFSTHVLPLLEKKCNNCHGGTFPSGGIRLDRFSEVMKYVGDGSLMGSIRHSSGFAAMPKNGTRLPACEITNIQNWINAGAPDN